MLQSKPLIALLASLLSKAQDALHESTPDGIPGHLQSLDREIDDTLERANAATAAPPAGLLGEFAEATAALLEQECRKGTPITDGIEQTRVRDRARAVLDRYQAQAVWQAGADDDATGAEGWGIFALDAAETRFEIQRIDDPEEGEAQLASDDAALAHVLDQAMRGSALHRRAITFVLDRNAASGTDRQSLAA